MGLINQMTIGLSAIGAAKFLPGPSISALLSLVLGAVAIYCYQRFNKPQIPIVNTYSWDLTGQKASREYTRNAMGLIAQGTAKFHGPFQIRTTNGPKLILPSSLWDWAKSCKDLDHQQLVHQDFFADYSGFEGQKFVTNPDRLLIDVIRLKLSQNPQSVKTMNDEVKQTLRQVWTDNEGKQIMI